MVSIIYHMKEKFILYKKIASYDLEIHAWLNTFIEQWQGQKSKIAKSPQYTAINENTLSKEKRACQKNQLSNQVSVTSLSSFLITWTPPPPPNLVEHDLLDLGNW